MLDSSAWLEYFADGANAGFFTLAINASHLSRECRLPLADSIILTTAWAHAATLWTQDSDIEGLEGVEFRRRAD